MKALLIAALTLCALFAEDNYKTLNYEDWKAMPVATAKKAIDWCVNDSVIRLGKKDRALARQGLLYFLTVPKGQAISKGNAEVLDYLRRLGVIRQTTGTTKLDEIYICEIVDDTMADKLGPAAETILKAK